MARPILKADLTKGDTKKVLRLSAHKFKGLAGLVPAYTSPLMKAADAVVDADAQDAQDEALLTLIGLTSDVLAALPDPTPTDGAATTATPRAAPAPTIAERAAAKQLFVAALEDDPPVQRMFELIYFPAIGADRTCSRVLGAKHEEVIAFADFALGVVDTQLRPLPPPYRQAELALIDRSIQIAIDRPDQIFGTDIAKELRKRGFRGAIVIITGDLDQLGQLPVTPDVDLVVAKGACARSITSRIRKAMDLRWRLEQLRCV